MNQASSESVSQNSAVFLLAMLALGTVAPTVFWGLPAIVGQIAQQWGFGAAQLGIAVLGEVFGMAAGTLLMASVLARQPVRITLTATILLSALANFVTPFAHTLTLFIVVRAVAGIGSGAMSGIAMTCLSYTKSAERNIGWLVLLQVLWSMALLGYVLPVVGGMAHATGTYVCIGVLSLAFLPAVALFGKQEAFVDADASESAHVDLRGVILLLGSLFALYFGVGVLWTFLEQIGMRSGLSEARVATTLVMANLVSLAACVVMPRLGRGNGLRRWAVVNIGACVVSAAALTMPQTPDRFALAAIVFIVAWTGAATLIFATMPRVDTVGRYATLSPGVLSLGFGIGSAAGGELIEMLDARAAVGLACVFCCASLLLYMSLKRANNTAEEALSRMSQS
ncbi:MFS transporter [Paraburkholderia sp. Ac-20340]|uniref:MFS transporter n=1 Tax=Paraburkholderia sp. Ac-20340 TaxID=2703888 RepID=UPI00198099D3|nr:MFS transporter [Paraburkholderia sp. Ac-20340]MBN3852174.1 MFS transporter [Paraburkholderia sp. Ac-20340]